VLELKQRRKRDAAARPQRTAVVFAAGCAVRAEGVVEGVVEGRCAFAHTAEAPAKYSRNRKKGTHNAEDHRALRCVANRKELRGLHALEFPAVLAVAGLLRKRVLAETLFASDSAKRACI